MSKEEIKREIDKVLDQFPDKALEDLLSFLKGLRKEGNFSLLDKANLDKLLTEDHLLLQNLAK